MNILELETYKKKFSLGSDYKGEVDLSITGCDNPACGASCDTPGCSGPIGCEVNGLSSYDFEKI